MWLHTCHPWWFHGESFTSGFSCISPGLWQFFTPLSNSTQSPRLLKNLLFPFMQLHQNTVDSHACNPEAGHLRRWTHCLCLFLLEWKGRLQHCTFNCKRMHLSVNATTFNCSLLVTGCRTENYLQQIFSKCDQAADSVHVRYKHNTSHRHEEQMRVKRDSAASTCTHLKVLSVPSISQLSMKDTHSFFRVCLCCTCIHSRCNSHNTSANYFPFSCFGSCFF